MASNHTQAVKPTEPEEGWEQSKGTWVDLAWNHSLPVKSTGPGWE